MLCPNYHCIVLDMFSELIETTFCKNWFYKIARLCQGLGQHFVSCYTCLQWPTMFFDVALIVLGICNFRDLYCAMLNLSKQPFS